MRPLCDLARQFLEAKGYGVKPSGIADIWEVDGIEMSDLGFIALATSHGPEWIEVVHTQLNTHTQCVADAQQNVVRSEAYRNDLISFNLNAETA